MKTLFRKSSSLLLFYLFIIVFIMTSPFWLWQIKETKSLGVLIIDKTVPDQTYREHKGLVWILNNEKYKKNDKSVYSPEQDYVGFKLSKNKQYKKEALPTNLESYQLIYLADQYGVYEEEFQSKNQSGKRSEKIYGGLTHKEVDQLEDALLKGNKTLIAEFNTFASPTENEVKEKISNLLNVTWSGWIGRYFADLTSDEVPVWVKGNYERQGKKWSFKGSGIVLVDRNDFIVVLEEKDLAVNGALFSFNKKGKTQFGFESELPYQYWFDIVKARNEEEVLATYELKVKSQGKEKLKKYGIPSEFPAIIHHQNRKFSSYYFAGDFADEPEVPGIYQSELLSLWKKYFDRTDSFYWQAYVPMMKQLLESGLMPNSKTEELVENKLINGINVNSQTNANYVQVLRNGKWEDFLIKGVNMGIAKPGYFPGEAAITKAEYARWFKAIGAMNANTVRIYTIHPPAFYEAFYEYNQTAKKPLYLFHGAWVNEEKLIHTQNAYSQEVTDDFQKEIRKMIDVIHGNATIPEEKGHATGTYSFDISPYVLGFIAGIEWDPEAVYNTNLANPDKATFNGTYFYTKEASPFEAWLARMMDFTTDYETKTYKWQHSMSFTNWVTTDLLDHPVEPLESEDKVAVNPNHIKKTEGFHGGLFASYHIYPYYPDVLNLDERYVNYKDENGKENNYLGYLNELMQAHEMPVLVAEFGVPSSRGITHKNVHGMDQGFNSEQEQGKINQTLFQSIVSEGYAGGIVFSWQDEWFKRTWNTMDYDNPDRRPYWTNTQTNEQRFGLLTFDPGGEGKSITIDGQIGDWERSNLKPIYKDQTKQALIKNMYIHSDEGYVYMRFDYQKPLNWKDMSSYVLIDSIDSQGQYSVPLGNQKLQTTAGVDFVVNLEGETNSRVLVDSYYDLFYFQYGYQLQMLEEIPNPIIKTKNNGLFHPIFLALNKKLDLPDPRQDVKFQRDETGILLFGNANPMSKDYNSLTDISISSDKKMLELRIPWQLINVRDPSQFEIIGDIWSNGLTAEAKTAGLRIAVIGTEKGNIISTLPQEENGFIRLEDMFLYKWNEWQYPSYQERLKESYYYMKEVYEKVSK